MAGTHKLYFAYGTRTLHAGYAVDQDPVARLVRAKGYTLGRDWLTLNFEGADGMRGSETAASGG
jgi:hypothetical protein